MSSSVDTAEAPIEVFDYSIDGFWSLVTGFARADPSQTPPKLHRSYFEEYFGALAAHTVVVEWSYTDRDFLEDYAGYYVRCFGVRNGKYRSRCARFHFFQATFDQAAFRHMLSGTNDSLEEQLKETYLGSIVVKPLPVTFVGRTCLKTYEPQGRRTYPVKREYEVHLAGLKLTVESLAFQEQDRIASACATSALWSLFHGTGVLFQHHIPTPIEITRDVTEQFPLFGRGLPSGGLNVAQVAAAIKSVGLEPETVGAETAETLKAAAYAYLRAGIPFVLFTAVYDRSEHDPMTGGPRLADGHVLTVAGFSSGADSCTQYPPTGTLFRSGRIDRLYVHDDQVGPFARVVFGGEPIVFQRQGQEERSIAFVLQTSWPEHLAFAPESIIVPLYHKIRIPLARIREEVLKLDLEIEVRRTIQPKLLPTRLEWDLYLVRENELKGVWRRCPALEGESLIELLEDPLPRFLWRAVAWNETGMAYEAVYDATDIEQGDLFIKDIVYDRRVFELADI